MKNIVFLASLLTFANACGRPQGQTEFASDAQDVAGTLHYPEDFVAHPIVLPFSEIARCPQGWSANADAKLCTDGARALGPFTQEMTLRCKENFADADFCDANEWPLEVATAVRGAGACMAGASLSGGDCIEGEFQYGPFRREFVEKCQRNKEQVDCASMRWNVMHAFADENQKLETYYSVFENYQKVFADVTNWFAPMNNGSTTSNGCVAFLTTALRHVGVEIPIGGVINGKGVSINTEGFDAYMRDELKWNLVRDASELQPGDAVVSLDRAGSPGHPDHVYMFHGWADKLLSVGFVIDNQVDISNRRNTYIHRRNIVADQTHLGRTPYARHYRAP